MRLKPIILFLALVTVGYGQSQLWEFGLTASGVRNTSYPASIVVPTGQVSAGSWITNGGPSMWESLDDDPDFGLSDGFSIEQNDITSSTNCVLVFNLPYGGLISRVACELVALSSGGIDPTVNCAVSTNNITYSATNATPAITALSTNTIRFPGLTLEGPATMYLMLDCSDNSFANVNLLAARLRINQE